MLYRLQSRYAPYLFLAPFIIIFGTFGLYPILKSIYLSFFITSGPTSQEYVGLQNFTVLFMDDDFWKAVTNTVIFAFFSVALQLPLALLLAVMLNSQAIKGRNVFRFIFFSPHLMGLVFAAILFNLLFADKIGLVNNALHELFDPDGSAGLWLREHLSLTPGPVAIALACFVLALLTLGGVTNRHSSEMTRCSWLGVTTVLVAAMAGILAVNFFMTLLASIMTGPATTEASWLDIRWLSEPDYVMPAMVILSMWLYVGFNMIYFLAALQAVPQELYEAASVDGAGPLRKFWHVTLPGIKPVVVFVVVLSTIGSFKLFELPWLLLNQQSGPDQAGLTIVMYLYQNGFVTGDLGYASAIGWTLTVGVILLALVQIRLSGTMKREA